jgi:hypothetical protein
MKLVPFGLVCPSQVVFPLEKQIKLDLLEKFIKTWLQTLSFN